jgi:hypothetical protein
VRVVGEEMRKTENVEQTREEKPISGEGKKLFEHL